MLKRLRGFKKRLTRLWAMIDGYDSTITDLYEWIDAINRRIGEHTVVHADVHVNQPSQVIVIGRYRNHDYVRVFNVDSDSLSGLIEVLKETEKNARVGRFDMPSHALPFSVWKQFWRRWKLRRLHPLWCCLLVSLGRGEK